MDTMNKDQLSALTDGERLALKVFEMGIHHAGEADVISILAALADARLEVARLREWRELLREAHGVLEHRGARGPMMDEIKTYLEETNRVL